MWNCSVARALETVGERWTLLVLREAFLVVLLAACRRWVGRGYVDVPPVRHLAVDALIGTVGGQDAQLFWVSANVVVGLPSHIGGAVSERIGLHGLPLLEQFVLDVISEIEYLHETGDHQQRVLFAPGSRASRGSAS